MKRSLAFAAAAILFVSGDLAAQAPRDLPMLVDAEWLAENLDLPELVVINVDQRRDGYDEGHVPGAAHLPYSRIAIEVDGLPIELPAVEDLMVAFREVGVVNDARIVLYGAPLSAARAWMTLDYLGLGDRAGILDGGITAWRAAGLPVSTEAPAPRTGALSLNPRPNQIVDADYVLAHLDDPNTVLIDARPLNEYTGADEGGRNRYNPGHIPGARHFYWEGMIHSADDPRLLPIEELQAQFEAVGASEDKTVVVYCTIGMRASMSYFVSRLLGYETRLYDGSWHDWSGLGHPTETGPDPLADGR